MDPAADRRRARRAWRAWTPSSSEPEDYLAAIRSGRRRRPRGSRCGTTSTATSWPSGPAAAGRRRTSRAACEADLAATAEPGFPGHLRGLWPAVTMPALLIRAERPLGAGGLLVPDEALAALRAAIGHLRVQPSARNHWTVMTDPAAIAAIDALVG